MDVIGHIIAVVVFIDRSVKVVDNGYAAGNGYIDFFEQIMGKGSVSKICTASVLEIAVCIDGLGKSVGHDYDPYIRVRILDRFDRSAQPSGVSADFVRIIGVVGGNARQIIRAVVDNGDHVYFAVIDGL